MVARLQPLITCSCSLSRITLRAFSLCIPERVDQLQRVDSRLLQPCTHTAIIELMYAEQPTQHELANPNIHKTNTLTFGDKGRRQCNEVVSALYGVLYSCVLHTCPHNTHKRGTYQQTPPDRNEATRENVHR